MHMVACWWLSSAVIKMNFVKWQQSVKIHHGKYIIVVFSRKQVCVPDPSYSFILVNNISVTSSGFQLSTCRTLYVELNKEIHWVADCWSFTHNTAEEYKALLSFRSKIVLPIMRKVWQGRTHFNFLLRTEKDKPKCTNTQNLQEGKYQNSGLIYIAKLASIIILKICLSIFFCSDNTKKFNPEE